MQFPRQELRNSCTIPVLMFAPLLPPLWSDFQDYGLILDFFGTGLISVCRFGPCDQGLKLRDEKNTNRFNLGMKKL